MTPAPPASSAPPAGWTLVFADEFETPGALDPAKWGYEIGYVRNDEKQYYTSRSENVRAENGTLVIEGRREAYQGYAYTSASVNTRRRFEFQYGRVEVRAKLPTGRGTWPAIWMLGTSIDQVGWPACGEIDVMENVGFEPAQIHGTIHTAAYNVDGSKYFTFRNEGTGGRAWPFDRPMYLLVNLAIGGSWGGQKGVDDALFPHR
jgi:beta-glucanase (GH16 family)